MSDNVMVYVDDGIKYIESDIQDIKKSFVRLGFHLYEFSLYGYYKHAVVLDKARYGDSYERIEDFASDYFDLSRSTCSRLIAICSRFCSGTMYLDSKYDGYSYSQLSEMLSLKDSMLPCVHPGMTIADIRDLKRRRIGSSVQSVACHFAGSEPNYITDSGYASVPASVAVSSDLVVCDVAQGEPEPAMSDALRELKNRLSYLGKSELQELLNLILSLLD